MQRYGKKIENIKLPEGYSFFWDSQYKDQKEVHGSIDQIFSFGHYHADNHSRHAFRKFPAATYHFPYSTVVTHRYGIRIIAHRIPVWFLLYSRMARIIRHDYKECYCIAG